MTRLAFIALAAIVLAGCSQRETVQTGYVPSASFAALATPEQIFANNDAAMAHFLASVGRHSPSDKEVNEFPGNRGSQLLLFTAEGLEDDAVRDMQWRVLLERAEGGYRVIEAGLRQHCRRSGTNQWTTTPCP
jgi:hypothetical protein